MNLSPDDCLEEYSLIWSEIHQGCVVSCVYPFYEPWQDDFVFYFGSITAVITFLLCYFYCLTALFRPVMLKFPNTNVVFQFFSLGLSSTGALFPLILGRDYVVCDTLITSGNTNWACVLSGSLMFYGYTCYGMWLLIFHLTIALRLYLIRVPKIAHYFFFFVCFGTWPMIAIISTTSLEYWMYIPGYTTCAPIKERAFRYSMFTSIFYFITFLNSILVIIICIRLLRIKVSAGVQWAVIFRKQMRLVFYWFLYVLFIISTFTISIIENETRVGERSDEEVAMGFKEYVLCVLLSSTPGNCKLSEFVAFPRFLTILPYVLVVNTYTIIIFFVFGTRLSLFRFWKEFFIHVWKTKSIPLPFAPHFDPIISGRGISVSPSSISTGVENRPRHSITSFAIIENDMPSETSGPPNALQKKLRKRLKEIFVDV